MVTGEDGGHGLNALKHVDRATKPDRARAMTRSLNLVESTATEHSWK